MPSVQRRTLLVVCDGHHCVFIDVGGHTMLIGESVESKEATFTDHEGRTQSPAAFGKGGLVSSMSDLNLVERNRLREFANTLIKNITHAIEQRGIEEWHLSGPDKFLSVLTEHLPASLRKNLKSVVKGIFVKEPAHDLLVRFRPDLERSAEQLRDQENYSPAKRPPKK